MSLRLPIVSFLFVIALATAGCKSSGSGANCGDGVVDPGEQCDPPDGVSCSDTCQFLVPPNCGDGVVDSDEECDDGENNSDSIPDACRSVCRLAFCGDSVIDTGEACDPPDGGSCGPTCQIVLPPGCGNGVIESGEECDDANTAGGDGCDANCLIETPPTCGDGIVDHAFGEECDDANTANGDGCSDQCRVEPPPTCGDGTLDIDNDEECDDGNSTAGDGCSPTCQFETLGVTCGNGTIEGLEVCDDGNTTNGDGCSSTCSNTTTTSVFVGQPGNPGFADDPNGSGTAQIGGYGVLTVDQDHLYFADTQNFRVRRIDIATQVVDTIAGNGNQGLVDDPDGANASFEAMEAITTDGFRLWIADDANCVIREVDLTPPHAVTTVAGSGNCNNHTDGNGTGAEFMGLRGLTWWNGLVYLLNPAGPTLRAFNPASGDVITIAGELGVQGTADGPGRATGSPGNYGTFISPRYITHDNSGVIYIGDTNGNKIRSYNTITDFVGTFCGDGSCGYVDGIGTAARVHRPRGMTSDGTSIYWVEFNAHTIRQGILATGEVSTLAGFICPSQVTCTNPCTPDGGYQEGVGSAARLQNPFDIVYHFPTGALYWVEGPNAVIRVIQ